MDDKKIKILVVDSSIDTAKVIFDALSEVEGLEPIFFTNKLHDAFDIVQTKKPDVMVLDIGMPHFEGLNLLNQTMLIEPIPIIATTFPTQKGKLDVIKAMELGAFDFVSKPTSYLTFTIDDLLPELVLKIKTACTANIENLKRIISRMQFPDDIVISKVTSKKIIIFSVGTGSLEPFSKFIKSIPADFPCMIAIIDMPHGFTKAFADRLNQATMLEVKEANEGDELKQGRLIIAPGDFHVKVIDQKGKHCIECYISEKVNQKRPSADVLMFSAAEILGKNSMSVMMSGVGKDGVMGMKAIKTAGGESIILDPTDDILPDTINRVIAFDAQSKVTMYQDIISTIVELL